MNTSLVSLNALSGNIWETGFRGEILYYPIEDYYCLPNDVLDMVVGDIIYRIEKGIDVLVFCLGGHGRTGYIAAAVLGVLGDTDPVGTVRKVCKSMIEDTTQLKSLAEYLQNPKIMDYDVPEKYGAYGYDWSDYRRTYTTPTNSYCNVCGAVMKTDICTFCGAEKYTSASNKLKRSNNCFLCTHWDADGKNKVCDFCVGDSMFKYYKAGIEVQCIDCDFYDVDTLSCGITGNIKDPCDQCDCQKSRKEMEEYCYE